MNINPLQILVELVKIQANFKDLGLNLLQKCVTNQNIIIFQTRLGTLTLLGGTYDRRRISPMQITYHT